MYLFAVLNEVFPDQYTYSVQLALFCMARFWVFSLLNWGLICFFTLSISNWQISLQNFFYIILQKSCSQCHLNRQKPFSLLFLYVPSVCQCVFVLYILFVKFSAVFWQCFGLALLWRCAYMSNLKLTSLAVTKFITDFNHLHLSKKKKITTFTHLQ